MQTDPGPNRRWLTALAFAMVGLCATGGRGETLIVNAPDRPGLECSVTFVNPEAREVTLEGFGFQNGQAVISKFPLSDTDRRCDVRVTDARGGRLARAQLDFGELNTLRHRFAPLDFFEPHSLRMALVSKEDRTVTAVGLLVTDSEEDVTEIVLDRLDRVDVVELPDLHAGPATVRVSVGGSLDQTCTVAIAAERPSTYLPIVVGAGQPVRSGALRSSRYAEMIEEDPFQKGFFLVVTLMAFAGVLLLWGFSSAIIALMPSHAGLPQGVRMRRATLYAVIIVGAVLLVNGLAMLALQEVTFLPLVTTIAACQLLAAAWVVITTRGASSTALTLATGVLILTLASSIVFLPAFALNEEALPHGYRMSFGQIVLVLSAITVVVISRMRAGTGPRDDSGLAPRVETTKDEGRHRCPRCGEPIHPVTGTCGCTVTIGDPDALALGRLMVKSGQGPMTHYALAGDATIGAADSCDVVLEGPRIGEVHCHIHIDGLDVMIRDAGEFEGTYVNGERVSERRLRDGDQIQIGESWVLFEGG